VSAHLQGIEILGACPLVDCVERGRRFARGENVIGSARQLVDVFTNPHTVILNPHGLASSRFDDTVARAVVSGGTRYHPLYGDPELTGYKYPAIIAVTFTSGRRQTFRGLEYATVKSATAQFDVGLAPTGNGARRASVMGANLGDPSYVKDRVDSFSAQLARLSPVTFAVADKIVKRGVDMTNEAEKAIKAKGSSAAYGPAMYENPRAHLQWHAGALVRELAGRDPKNTVYDRADDLKKYAVAAYLGLVSASEDTALQDSIRAGFWSDISTSLQDSSLAAARAGLNVASKAAEGAADTLGAMKWVLYGILGVAGLAAGAYGVHVWRAR